MRAVDDPLRRRADWGVVPPLGAVRGCGMSRGETTSSIRSRPWCRPRVAAIVTAGLVALVLAGCGEQERQAVEDVAEREAVGDFFEVPDPLPPGEPGTLIRSRRLLGAPAGAQAWRVLYRSTDRTGKPIAVSGVVVAPDLPSVGHERTVVSWAHPTTGAQGQRCAPSAGIDPFILMEGLHELLRAGYVVAATDYSNMGAEGSASYLVGDTEGRNVLDAVRAAQQIEAADAGDETLLWGHSQGGQAALFAGQIAPEYAPELDLKGVAVAAPAGELGLLLDADIVDVSGVTIGAYAFGAFQEAYADEHPDLELTSVLTPQGAAAVPEMMPLCLLGQNKQLHAIADPLIGSFVKGDPTKIEPWATFLEENTPGGTKIEVPVLVTQGLKDALVVPTTTDALVRRLCAAGDEVQYRRYSGADHGTVGFRSVPLVIPWMKARVAGEPLAAGDRACEA
jgi:pimeloyl-ACP methyl ester carboxylesterase